MPFWQYVAEQISAVTNTSFQCRQKELTAGGCINQTQKISDGEKDYFIKINQRSLAPMFASEAQALEEISATKTIKVPDAIVQGEFGEQSFLVLEYLDLQPGCNMVKLAHQLANMHRITQPKFGWSRNNVIGSTEQLNQPMDQWPDFWQQNRLEFQLRLAKNNGYGGKLQILGERLLADMPVLFENYSPTASMLHGDLWAGNTASLKNSEPVIYDPALYYGDRETDLAMTELFGGFTQDFYSAYNDAWPLDEDYRIRKYFYNIYHLINHLNLFGGNYGNQAIQMMQRILSEI